MTLKDNGWFSWAIQDPGPENRILPGLVLPMSVVVHHSMEGTYNYPGGYTVLRDPEGFPTAWHWTVKRDGRVLQHYGAFRHLQHAHAANVLGPGGESEGYQREPLTPEQVAAWRRIHADINEYRERQGLPPFVRDIARLPQGTKRGWVEHREMAPAWNTTQCPSERYAPLWAEEDLVTQDEFDAMFHDAMARLLPVYLPLVFEDGTAKFSDRPDVPISFPYQPWGTTIPEHTHDMPEQATITGGITK